MRRRDLIAAMAAGAAAPWSLAARAQQAAMPVVGFLDSGRRSGMDTNLAAFHRGLAEAGFAEGKNVTIAYRWAEGRYGELPALAADLIQRGVAVIAATRSSAPAHAAKAATSRVPIVFQTGSDPVQDGLVASLNRPGGNVTGATRLTTELIQKRLEVLSLLVPTLTRVALLVNPAGPQTEEQVNGMRGPLRERGLALYVAKASTEAELEAAFAGIVAAEAGALIVGSDNLFIDRRKQIVALTIKHAIATIFFERDSVVDGGLMSYSASLADQFRQVGAYVGRILKGESPSELPVLLPAKFDLIINMRSAKALGVAIPPTLLALADEVIE
jgi:putative ABC transport system substrate-binding protein